MDDHELLVRMDENVQAIYEAVYGNGQPGLITRVARIEGSNTKAAAGGGVAGSIATLLVTAILRHFGFT